MIKKIITYYKIPLLISSTLAVTILAQAVSRDAFEIFTIIFGCLLGTFVLDAEYILYAYMYDPESDFSKNVIGYIKSKDYKNLVTFINTHKSEIKDKSLNSVIFQVIIAAIGIFVAYSPISYFIKAFVLSISASTIYKLIEIYFEGDIDDWFWAVKNKPNKQGVFLFIIVLIAILVFCINLL